MRVSTGTGRPRRVKLAQGTPCNILNEQDEQEIKLQGPLLPGTPRSGVRGEDGGSSVRPARGTLIKETADLEQKPSDGVLTVSYDKKPGGPRLGFANQPVGRFEFTFTPRVRLLEAGPNNRIFKQIIQLVAPDFDHSRCMLAQNPIFGITRTGF